MSARGIRARQALRLQLAQAMSKMSDPTTDNLPDELSDRPRIMRAFGDSLDLQHDTPEGHRRCTLTTWSVAGP
jgi:hypothetical protein